MLLCIVDGTEFRDVPIKEGEMFLLPREPSILPVVGGQRHDMSVMLANTPHNPVRFVETIGIVIELQRPEASLGLHGVPPIDISLIKNSTTNQIGYGGTVESLHMQRRLSYAKKPSM